MKITGDRRRRIRFLTFSLFLLTFLEAPSQAALISPDLRVTQRIALPDGALISVLGETCADRVIEVKGAELEPSEPAWGIHYSIDEDCGVKNVQFGVEEGIRSPNLETPEAVCRTGDHPYCGNPGGPLHTYVHGFTWIRDPEQASLDLAEFETVSGSYWNGEHAWWRDAGCCAGWAYGIADDYMPHWQTTAPWFQAVETECHRFGPARCATDVITAIVNEEWTIADVVWWADCGKPPNRDQSVFLQHSSHITKDGTASVVFTLLPCPGLTPFHTQWTDSQTSRGGMLTNGISSSQSG